MLHRWQLVRVASECACDARDGTVKMETFDGAMELFQCNVVFQPGSLAAACLHESWPGMPAAEAGNPKVWLFCADPLCLMSKPNGSRLPPW
jgi:hypothetical protein